MNGQVRCVRRTENARQVLVRQLRLIADNRLAVVQVVMLATCLGTQTVHVGHRNPTHHGPNDSDKPLIGPAQEQVVQMGLAVDNLC